MSSEIASSIGNTSLESICCADLPSKAIVRGESAESATRTSLNCEVQSGSTADALATSAAPERSIESEGQPERSRTLELRLGRPLKMDNVWNVKMSFMLLGMYLLDANDN